MEEVILDVREQDEFEAEHIEGAVWVPLSSFSHTAPGVLSRLAGKKVLIMCRSGARAAQARAQIARLGFGGQLQAEVFEGGMLEWARQGRPVVSGRSLYLPIMRQVQIAAGFGILLSSLAALYWRPEFGWIAAFFGAGLAFAGISGWCGLAALLGAMPWNRGNPGEDCRRGKCCG